MTLALGTLGRGANANASATKVSAAAANSQPPPCDARLTLLDEIPEGSRTLCAPLGFTGPVVDGDGLGSGAVAGSSMGPAGVWGSLRVQTSTSSRAAKVRVVGALPPGSSAVAR